MHATILRACVTLIVLSITASDYARGEDAFPDPNPLQPADTSSPRATLRSFLTDTDFIIRRAMNGVEPNQQAALAFLRAIEALDFRNTPNGNVVAEQTRRIVLLKEILDRIELPDDAEIPDSAQVAEGAVTSWTIPGTRIRIARVDSGPRAGEFLFSAATVERLPRLYRLAEDLPYQPGATPGAYKFLTEQEAAASAQQAIKRPLKPVDTSTPRTVIDQFLESVNRAYATVMDAEAAWRSTPRTLTPGDARKLDADASQLLARAATALDLSQVPKSQREDVAFETALQLKEVLDRLPLVPIEIFPDALDIARRRAAQESPRPIRWRIPNTELDIVEIADGDRQGEFLFSSRTVRLVSDLYERIADLPYREDVFERETGYLAPRSSPGFYEHYTTRPGSLVPYASLVGRLLDDLPPWLITVRGGHTVWQWLGLILCTLFVVVIGFVLFRVLWRIAWRSSLDEWLRLLAPLAVASLVAAVVHFIDTGLNITGNLLAIVTTAGGSVEILMRGLAAFLFFKAAAETIVARTQIGTSSMDASLVRLSAKVFGFLAAVYVVVAGARSLGADLVPVLAGLGVGGLAIALAAQKTLANFLGSIVLFAERPVREGEFFSAGDLLGTVEKIGLHSTRIRTLERTVVTVPNAQLSEMLITNISRRDRRLFKTELPLRDDTSTEQMRGILDEIQALLSQHPKVLPTPRVRFIGFGDYSENVEIFAYLDCVDQTDFLTIQEELLMRIEEIIIAAGSGFALPSQITQIKGTLDPAADEPKEGPV